MPRPKICRRVAVTPTVTRFEPSMTPQLVTASVNLSIEEVEAVRLADLMGLAQDQASEEMGISQPTFHRILEAARKKIADALINGKAMNIGGGDFVFETLRKFRCHECSNTWEMPHGAGRPEVCPKCGSKSIHRAPDERGQGRRGRGHHGPPWK